MKAYKYKHIETGLFLKKRKHAYSSVYELSKTGTVWQRKVMGTLSMTKNPSVYGYGPAQFFKPEEFELIEFKLTELCH